jgi:membrane protein
MKRKFIPSLRGIFTIIRNTASAWVKADPFRQSSTVAYYAVFSIPPLLIIIIALTSLAFGREIVEGHVFTQIRSSLGNDVANQIKDTLAKSSIRKNSVVATTIGIITLIIGSTGVFAELQTSLNQIWEVKVTTQKKWLKKLKDRLFSFGLILSIGFLLLISLLLTTFLEAFGSWIKNYFPDFMLVVFKVVDFLFSFGVISILFALIFKILPDVKVRWRDVWMGAGVTTFLFIIGKIALSVYFAKARPDSAYGAAGSVVLIMLWVSYSCMILFFGAEFTKQFAIYYGRKIEPAQYAELMSTIEQEKKK